TDVGRPHPPRGRLRVSPQIPIIPHLGGSRRPDRTMRAETRRTERRGPVRRQPIPTLSEPEEFLHALESVSRGVRDPVAKLRFIRTSLSRYQALDRAVRAVPSAPLRRLLYRWL